MADPQLKEKVEEMIGANPILLFMKGTPEMPRCGFSMRVVQVLDEDGGGQHLRAEVTAPQFEGLSRIDQHRLVKAAVKPRFDDGSVHALSVKTSLPG